MVEARLFNQFMWTPIFFWWSQQSSSTNLCTLHPPFSGWSKIVQPRGFDNSNCLLIEKAKWFNCLFFSSFYHFHCLSMVQVKWSNRFTVYVYTNRFFCGWSKIVPLVYFHSTISCGRNKFVQTTYIHFNRLLVVEAK